METATRTQENIKRMAQRVMGLPPLPTLVAKLIALIDDPRTSAASLGKLIATDQVMTARVLKLANSAFYGFPRRVATVNLAIVVLGFDTLKDLCVTVSLRDWFPDQEPARTRTPHRPRRSQNRQSRGPRSRARRAT